MVQVRIVLGAIGSASLIWADISSLLVPQNHRCLDSHFFAAGNDALWRKLCAALGMGELADDPRFASNAQRTENHAELEPLLGEIIAESTVEKWCALLGEAGVPSGPLCDVGQVFHSEQVAAREMIIELEHPIAGVQAMPNSPLKFSQTPVELNTPAPLLGQHTEEILGEILGLSAGEIEVLRTEGAI